MTILKYFAGQRLTGRQVLWLFIVVVASALTLTSRSFAEPPNKLADGRYLIQGSGATVNDRVFEVSSAYQS
ncbi:hypothetical protein N0A02_29670 [Paraburkholderia acidicola]|uniref:Uncharacterized protein n=1 Tax=Paraburkholderia acidicola TaxID=1912599 RepID=A0ABV1LWB5_9BURK